MSVKNDEVLFECLNSIGNSFELESMISEIMITYYRQTKAIYTSYSKDDDIIINIGKHCQIEIDRERLKENRCFSFTQGDKVVVVLPLKIGYLSFVYEGRYDEEMEYIISLISRFQKKINFAISACKGVEALESFNAELEYKVEESSKKITEQEKILLVKSKNIVMGEMIEMIAHQWRQPITTIGMISNNIILNILLDELDISVLKDDLEGINRQIKYLSDTIDDFRSFFKESKQEEEFVLSDVITSSIALLEKQFAKSAIALVFENKCQKIVLKTFKSELIQALINIVANAKEAFADGKKDKFVKVSCSSDANGIYINIEDNAGGIDEDIIDKVFDLYFSTKKQKNGTGLGLYVSKIIICEHLHGSISAKNKASGAVFEIVLPIQKSIYR
ncbi:hypothetical protein M947_00835 [Sulfurimonas hongkongensis]|uniref:histidine kinase n=1 Tax=Sulfurimonas hongkongensis TaxID=1172190 RepID=T0KTN7_9BACT|nr:HAMP domain-containing sensor histidine kinase [Sulfurimonas hongkongensis]EQB40374.1 hypothetical protein M947_00835 [Sulfurimonas hongkongensis]